MPLDHPSDRDAALEFLLSRIDYERTLSIPYGRRDFRLQRMRDLLSLLGNPERGLPIVHVAGTKGKGSTSAIIAAILNAAGYRVGVFSSPHLERIEERLSVDGLPCTTAEFVELVDEMRDAVATMDRQEVSADDPPGDREHLDDLPTAVDSDAAPHGPTFFEITTAMALVYFRRRKVDMAVIEVGLGGRLDSTNVCQPLVSAITSISFDHMAQLGNSLASIAGEKAGIIKRGVPIVSGVLDAEPRDVIADVAARCQSPLIQSGRDFTFDYSVARGADGTMRGLMDFYFQRAARPYRYEQLELGMLGRHQAANSAVALACVDVLREKDWTVSEDAVRAGLLAARAAGRVQLISTRPALVIDAAHNVASVAALLETLRENFSPRRRVLIFGTTLDKQVREMLALLLPAFDRVILTRYFNNPRAVAVEDLWKIATELGHPALECVTSPAEAWEKAREGLAEDDLLCVTGSFFLAGEILAILREQPRACATYLGCLPTP